MDKCTVCGNCETEEQVYYQHCGHIFSKFCMNAYHQRGGIDCPECVDPTSTIDVLIIPKANGRVI